MIRCFISIGIPEKIKEDIRKIQERLPEFYGKKTEKENLHLTLKFLGDVKEERIDRIKERLKEVKLNSFEVKLGEIGVFKENFIKIIWIKLENCEKLQKEVDRIMADFFPKEERFMSHITIARIKDIKDKEEFLEKLKKIDVVNEKFKIDKFYLMKSKLTTNGPVYKSLGEYKLG